jgi:GNAT superfamily N-acetyltransferase
MNAGAERDGLTLRSGYFADRAAFLALSDLLEDTFDIDISLLDRFGGPDLTAMPFGWFDADGRCVANFSAFSMPLVIDGRQVRAVGYQSGAVRPEYRGRGLYRDVMRRAFAWADAEGFDAGILLTDKPELYRPYGFEAVPQHAFTGPMPAVSSEPAARQISLDHPADLAMLMDLLEARTDVSRRFAARRQTKTFLLNACFDPDIRLSHLRRFDAVVAWKAEGGVLGILDVVALEMPDVADIAGALGAAADRITVLFPPDLLGWQGTAEAYRGSCELMIRGGGAAPVPAEAFMLSPMMDF